MTALPASDRLTTVALVTLGCARNEVDSEELAGRLEAGGFRLVEDPEHAETVVVNTCGFVEAAKKDSVDTLLEAADLKGSGTTQAVVAVGCLAERYGDQLASSLPEADAVLGFDDYPDIAARLRGILAGERHSAHAPQDRRRLLPIRPRRATPALSSSRATPSRPRTCLRTRLRAPVRAPSGAGSTVGRWRPLKLASGCDRRCSFCAIPSLPRVVRLPAAVRRPRRGALAGRPGRPRAVPGQRELHVLRQGPRRPAAAGDAAARAGGGRGDRAGAGVLPAARGDPAGAGRRHRRDGGRGRLLRPLLPARLGGAAAPDAAVRRPGQLPRSCSTGSAPRRRRPGCGRT